MLSEESTVSSERLRVSRRKQMKPQHKVEGCKDGKETNESMSSDASGGTESSSSSGDGKLPHPSTTTTTPTLTGIITPHGGIIHTQTAATCSNETSDQQAYKTEKNNPIDLNTRSLSASNNTTHPMVSCINPMTDLTQHGEANCMEPVVSQSMKRSVSDHGSEGMRSTENERMNSYHQSDMETDQEMNETDAVATAVSMSGSNQHFSDSDLMESGKELLAGKALERCNYSPRNRDKDQEEKESFNDSLNPRLLKEISQSIASNQTKSQSKNSNIENESLRNEMNEMKDQLRIIQHQYMYQAQRIQYLNLQVSLLAASHHQGALQNREQQCQTPPLPRSSSTNSNITIDKNIADHSSQIGSRNITSKLQDFILAAAAQQGYSGTGVGGMTSQSNQPSAYGGGASVVDRVTKSTFPCIPASMMQQNKFLFHNEFANEARNGERAQECKSCSHVFKNESALQAHLISGTCQDGPTQQNFISLAACSNQNLSTDEAVDKHERGGIGTEIEAEMRGLNHGGRDSLVLQSNFKNDEDSDQHLMSHKLLPTHRKSEESSDGGAASADKEDMDNDNFISTVFQNSISKNPLPGLSALRSMNFGRRVGAASSGSELMSTSETFKLQELVEQIDKKKSLDKNECERPYKCDICSRDFPTRGYLRTHYSSVHRSQMVAASCSPVAPNLNSATGTTIASGLECKLCRNRFPDQQALQQHMQLHMLFSNQNQHQQQHEQVAQLFQKYNAAEEGKRPHHGVGYSSNSLFSMDFVKQRPSPTTSTATAAVTEQSVGSMYHNLLSNTENSDCMSPQSSSAGEPSISNSKDAAANPSDLVDYQSENKLDKSTPLENQLEKVTAAAAGFDETTKKSDENDDLCPNQIALDLTRPNPKESDEAGTSLQSVSDPVKCENSSFTPTFLASNSLSALAQLASNSSLMRHDRLLPSHQLEFQSSSMQNEEVRNRKLAIACDICSKPFSCQSALDIHLRSHTKERPYKCRVCDRGFTTKGNLKQHLLTHNMTEVEDKMLDPVCSPKSFNQNLSVTGEQQKKTYVVGEKRHLENNGSQTAPDAKKNYPRHWCHVCQKQFSSASSLQIHNRTHTGEKPFACSVCGRAFTTKGNLKVHMGTHVWGAGGSRRGRRISMDNPLISPWMQNTAVTASSSHTPTNPQSLIRFPGPLADRAMFYQQYAALASRNFGVKPLYAGFNSLLPLGNTATSRLLMNSNNGQVNPLAPTSESVPTFNPNLLRPENSNKLAAQLIWKVCQRAQEQVN